MKKRVFLKILILILTATGLMWAQACLTSKQKSEPAPQIVITNAEGKGFSFELSVLKGKSFHYPLMAAWIEDVEGNYIQTLFVAKSVARGEFAHADASSGSWKAGPLLRPATLPYWAHKYHSTTQHTEVYPSPQNPVPDAYSGATPTGSFILKAKSDKPLSTPFRVYFEINQFFDFNDFWTNNKFPDDNDYKTSGQPALIYASDIIYPNAIPASLTLRLIGHSHYSGKDGSIFTSLETITTARHIVSTITLSVTK